MLKWPIPVARIAAIMFALLTGSPERLPAQATHGSAPGQTDSRQLSPPGAAATEPNAEVSVPEEELRQGSDLTRRGDFNKAIPHLLAARAQATSLYAASFNLAICYLGIHQYAQAIQLLNDLKGEGRDNANVENLLAQAYIGSGQERQGLQALESASTMSPQDEKLYALVADACTDQHDFALGLKVADIGLRNLPNSARLHYERALLLSQLDRLDRAKADFSQASKLGQGGEIGYVSAARLALLEGSIPEAVRVSREGIKKGFQSPVLLTTLGEALVRSGVTPGESDFIEAQTALEKAVAERPNDPAGQISLGQIYLMTGRLDDSIDHLQKARQLMPNQPSIYASLAKAYQKRGDSLDAERALAILEKLNLDRAEHIRSAPGERKMSYGGGEVGDEEVPSKPQQ